VRTRPLRHQSSGDTGAASRSAGTSRPAAGRPASHAAWAGSILVLDGVSAIGHALRRQRALVADVGSDRLVDAVYGLGTVEGIGERVREHLAAGADHVCLRVVTNAPMAGAGETLPRAAWRELSALVGSV
jgi:hypothetical protein